MTNHYLDDAPLISRDTFLVTGAIDALPLEFQTALVELEPAFSATSGYIGRLQQLAQDKSKFEGLTGLKLTTEVDFKSLIRKAQGQPIAIKGVAKWRTLDERHVRLFEELAWVQACPIPIAALQKMAPKLEALLEGLKSYIKEKQVVMFHCTKEPWPGYFKTAGLRPLDGDAHRTEFLRNFGHLFTAEELGVLKRGWDHSARTGDLDNRNCQLWGCLTPNLLTQPYATGNFFEYFGGEAIFSNVSPHSTIADKLRNIGEAVVVVFSTIAEDIQLNGDPYKTLALQFIQSYCYARGIQEAEPGEDGYIQKPVQPSNILAVISKIDLPEVLASKSFLPGDSVNRPGTLGALQVVSLR